MSVDLIGIESECLEFLTQVDVGHDLICGAVKLQIIVVYEYYQVIQLIFVRSLGCLPDFTFLAFAVAYDHKYAVVPVVLFRCDSHSYAAGKSLAERTCGDINAGTFFHIRMALQNGTFLAEGAKHGFIEESKRCQSRILYRAYMAF